jgi:hypothetical protein
MAATDIIFTGLSYAIGASVEVVIGGLDCGAFTVASPGTVTVPLASIPVPEGYPDAGTYLLTLDVGPYNTTAYGDATNMLTMQVDGGGRATMYIPIYIGFPYPSLGAPMRPTGPQQIKSPAGGSTGKLRRVWSIAVLLSRSQGLQFGTNTGNLLPAAFQFDGGASYPNNLLFDGVHYMTVEDNDSYDGIPWWYAPGVYPVCLNSLTAFTETKERT